MFYKVSQLEMLKICQGGDLAAYNFFELYAFIILTSTLVRGMNYFVVYNLSSSSDTNDSVPGLGSGSLIHR